MQPGATDKRSNHLLSERNYYSTKFFTEHLLAIEIRKTQIFMDKPVYLSLSILELSKIVMYQCWFDCIKHKYQEQAKLCYIGSASFFIYIKMDDIHKDIAEDAETRFDN